MDFFIRHCTILLNYEYIYIGYFFLNFILKCKFHLVDAKEFYILFFMFWLSNILHLVANIYVSIMANK
jgi:hypothetical protein